MSPDVGTLRDGREIVQHTDGQAVDAGSIRSDVVDVEKLLSEVFDGVKGGRGEAEILVDEGIAGTQGVSKDRGSAGEEPYL